MLSYGVTTIEAKTGYGLSLIDEMKMLEVMGALNQLQPIQICPTFLGAHAIPPEYKNRADDAALCLAVCNAFERARRLALEELHAHDALPVSLPWLEYDYARAVAALGEDYWPYGLRRNRAALEALVRYSTEQGIASRMCAPEELLAPATHTWSP